MMPATSWTPSGNRTSRSRPARSAHRLNTSQFQLALNTTGRLTDEQQFRDIILKTGAENEVVRLGDVARVEMGAQTYSIQSLLDNKGAWHSDLPGTELQRPGTLRCRSRQNGGAEEGLPVRR